MAAEAALPTAHLVIGSFCPTVERASNCRLRVEFTAGAFPLARVRRESKSLWSCRWQTRWKSVAEQLQAETDKEESVGATVSSDCLILSHEVTSFGDENQSLSKQVVEGTDKRRNKEASGVPKVRSENYVSEPHSGLDSEKDDGIAYGDSGESASDVSRQEEDEELEIGYKMSRVCDRLIEVFMIEKTTPLEWRKLLAFSEEWTRIRPHFFKRCQINAMGEEDPKKKGDILKLARKLKEVDSDMMRHDDLLAEVEKNPLNVDTVVAKRRKDFTGDFFEHLHTLCDASYKDLNRRDEIASVAGKCLSAIEAYDSAQEDSESLAEAQLKFDDILSSPSLEAAVNKIDQLAQRQELDSTLMLLITKAWAAAKESTMMKEEVKDIMLHLYNVARGNMQRLIPKEVRIIRHLLSIPDPRERFAAMTDAFSPGDELEGKNEDMLYTTPETLHKWVKIILDAYYTNKQGTLIKEAQKLMNPEVINRLEVLKEVLEDQFM